LPEFLLNDKLTSCTKTALLLSALFSLHAFTLFAQINPDQSSSASPELPDAPSYIAQQQGTPTAPHTARYAQPYGPIPGIVTAQPFTLNQKWTSYTHQAFGPPALVFPAISSAIEYARGRNGYPSDWTDGAGAYGRLYGNALATATSKRTAAFLTEAVLHEDPRYKPATVGTSTLGRIGHALAFTIMDRTDSGNRTFAFNNFASAAAGGFVGMAYMPPGYNDLTHASQRSLTGLAGIGVANISREFAPQWGPLAHKLHLFSVLPAWWVPTKARQP
jgi:hypothetical protein